MQRPSYEWWCIGCGGRSCSCGVAPTTATNRLASTRRKPRETLRGGRSFRRRLRSAPPARVRVHSAFSSVLNGPAGGAVLYIVRDALRSEIYIYIYIYTMLLLEIALKPFLGHSWLDKRCDHRLPRAFDLCNRSRL